MNGKTFLGKSDLAIGVACYINNWKTGLLGPCGSDFAAFTRRQIEDYTRVIRELNLKAE